jgi:hypothetical protein
MCETTCRSAFSGMIVFKIQYNVDHISNETTETQSGVASKRATGADTLLDFILVGEDFENTVRMSTGTSVIPDLS